MAFARRYVRLQPDDENNADTWWSEMDVVAPEIARDLRDNDFAVVTEEVYARLAELPGWSNGPEYAPEACSVEKDPGPGWESVG